MLGTGKKVEGRGSRARRRSRLRRRGVLLLVVLSMLVLFMLIGTAFLMSSSQQSKNAGNAAKMNSVGNPPTKDLDNALMQVLRDSDNEHSAIRYHSLLRDIYGTDGFQGVVYSPDTMDIAMPTGQVTRFAAATAGTAAQQLGPTAGQFIDIYVRALGWDIPNNKSVNDPLTLADESSPLVQVQPDSRHVIRLEKNYLGRPQLYTLPVTKGYFNGCLLTITSGPAAGQSTRVLDYEYVGDTQQPSGTVVTRLFRFRVMAFARADGQPLQIVSRPPEIADLAGATFIVNGRAFSGTGVGYNPFAVLGQPRLNAQERVQMGSDASKALYPEVALMPNAAYFFPCDPDTNPSHTDMWGVRIPVVALPMNPKITTSMTAAQIATALSQWRYPTFAGPGDVNESYDAPDFQNLAIALQTVTPRSQGRVVQGTSASNVTLSATDPSLDRTKFLRFDLEDVTIPSFFRPDLANYWFHRLLFTLTNSPFSLQPDEAVAAILDPYPNGTLRSGLSSDVAALVTAIKRKVSLRPLREDNPHFNGGNPMSVVQNLPTKDLTVGTAPNLNIAIPYWEAVGPWDVDNDNDGVPDSVWVDVGNPVQVAADGTRYKALVSYLIVDLDSRLNVNAHGLADDILPPTNDPTKANFFDPTQTLAGSPGNLAHAAAGTLKSTLQLPRGLGYGPAEISLRPLFPAPVNASNTPLYGNRFEPTGSFAPVDDYAAILRGRILQDGGAVFGKYGLDNTANAVASAAATAGTNYAYALRRPNWKDDPNTVPDSPLWFSGERSTPGLAAQLKFFDYPWSNIQVSGNQTSFGTAPDLKARYALGLNYYGQPVYEVANDVNPNNTNLAFDLLAKSPYELDLNSTQRRDHWAANNYADATAAFNSTVDFSATGGQSGLSDDAPFSTTDLEKVLRAWDADAGTLPSRLWDCVSAFDPLKLSNVEYGDPYRVVKTANAAFGLSLTNPPRTTDPEYASYLATSQQIAGINRRLVTTDSYDLPVAGGTVPNQAALAVGPDGQPGRAGLDEDPDGTGPLPKDNVPDDPSETGLPGTDDFKAIIGKEPARATIADLLQYRIWTEARRFEMRRQSLTEAALAALNTADYAKFLNMVTARGQLVLAQSPQLLSDLIAPEVIGGNRMDLNRPFGDGRDNPDPITGISDGVVDDPLEAGDPFLDMNGNGKWDNGEPFIDLAGNGYTPPGDHLWSDLTANGTLGEQIGLDYTNGQATRLHAVLANALKNIGGVRNLESQGRQVFARQLYCLMLLLMDENYIAPWDENDPQVMTWMEAERKKLTSATPAISAPEADYIVKRKLTCRMIAQWAANCVDMRDADVIMTPFEYDENPWDGWGVWNDEWTKDVTVQANVSKLSFLPLDGDVATDENVGEVIDWPNVPKSPNPNTKKLTTLPTADVPTHPLDQTRGFVWGAERPELLITETTALHDRRTEDLLSQDPGGHDEIKTRGAGSPPADKRYQDLDLDQGLRPRGSAFVELYNPWSEQGQLPAEIYSRVDVSTGYLPKADPAGKQGVDLSRLSNLAWDDVNNRLTANPTDSSNKIKRSPVWRMIVVEEWPNAKNIDDKFDNTAVPPGEPGSTDRVIAPSLKQSTAYTKVAASLAALKPWVPTNPDFDPLFGSDMVQKVVSGVVSETRMIGPAFGFAGKRQDGANNLFYESYPNIEREFYFTTDKSPVIRNKTTNEFDWDFSNNRANFNLRIPDRSIKVGGLSTTGYIAQTQKFIPPYLELRGLKSPYTDVERKQLKTPAITPIMPGHYGLVGSASTNYDLDLTDPFDANRPATYVQSYVTTIGRNEPTGQANEDDKSHQNSVQAHSVRRIEMRPDWWARQNATPTNPLVQQLMVASNGGDPQDKITMGGTYDPYSVDIARDNEVIVENNVVKNIYSSTNNANGSLATDANNKVVMNDRYYLPCVTIPVEGMSVSEPPWGYGPRESQAEDQESALRKKNGGSATPQLTFKHTAEHQEGRYFTPQGNLSSYDKPFDTAPELIRTGTTANYRMIHLQRLANPLLPWNPPPLLADGKTPNPEHRANMPINPYLTVDSSSVNLTAFNGTSNAEGDIDHTVQKAQGKMRPWVYGQGTAEELTDYLDNYTNGGKGVLNKKLKQVWAFRSLERGATARQNLAGSAATPATNVPQRVLWAQEPAQTTLTKPAAGGQLPELKELVALRQMTTRFDEVPNQVQTDQKIIKNFCNMVLKHSLGFGNESYGLAYTRADAPTAAAVGAPKPSRFLFTHNVDPANGNVKGTPPTVDSTNPWFAWNNRPYASADELLNVPAGSAATMLRMYSTIDPNKPAASTPNPYGLAQLGDPTNLKQNLDRLAVMQAPFGQMLNMFAASLVPAGSANGTGGNTPYGAPNFYRILDYVQVPSRFVGTDTMLNAETFNDPAGNDITSPLDPRYSFQPPFNKVSRERDPGRVNLNTITGRRAVDNGIPNIWSEVYDGIMHRVRDGHPVGELGQCGPAWRDVVLSRRGYVDPLTPIPLATAVLPLKTSDRSSDNVYPDVASALLNPQFPTIFSNPFRSSDSGDLVPIAAMVQTGVNAGLLRSHPYSPATGNVLHAGTGWGADTVDDPNTPRDDRDDNNDGLIDDAREAGIRPPGNNPVTNKPYAKDELVPSADSRIPLFSDRVASPFLDGDRNPYNMYQPLTRLGNLVTDRSNVYAVWVTIGYFEVEPAPNWNDPDPATKSAVRQRFGATNNDTDAATVAGLALYNRVYPEGYMLGRELGSDTGNVTRPRGFYIIDRSEPVGFKPGEDLNVEKAIRLRRRIE